MVSSSEVVDEPRAESDRWRVGREGVGPISCGSSSLVLGMDVDFFRIGFLGSSGASNLSNSSEKPAEEAFLGLSALA